MNIGQHVYQIIFKIHFKI